MRTCKKGPVLCKRKRVAVDKKVDVKGRKNCSNLHNRLDKGSEKGEGILPFGFRGKRR